jgi:hypothetical protein
MRVTKLIREYVEKTITNALPFGAPREEYIAADRELNDLRDRLEEQVDTYAKELLAIAEKENLIVTCGGDFHADTYRPKCGMFLPDGILDHIGLRDYLLSSEETKLCIQEPNADTCEVISLKRSKTI